MEFPEYIYIILPYCFIVSVLVLLYMKYLYVFKYRYTIGFMGAIWYVYNFIVFPLVGFFYFDFFFKTIDVELFFLVLVLIYIYFFSIFLGFFISARIKSFELALSKISLEGLAQKLCDSVRLSHIIAFYLILVSYKLYDNYLTYGTINVFKIISLKLPEEKIIQIIGSKIYIYALFESLIRNVFVLLSAILILKRRIVIAILFLVLQFYLMLSTKSKYVLLYPLFFFVLYNFFVRRIRMVYFLLVLFVFAALGIYSINVVRSGGNIYIDDLEEFLNSLIYIVVWRADFLYGFYILIEKILSGEVEVKAGITMLSIILRIIPRALFPSRMGASDVEMTREIFGFTDEKGWSFTFGGIGEFVYNFHIPGLLVIGVLNGILVHSMNKLFIHGIRRSNFIILSLILSNPIWYMPWNIGINEYIGQSIILSFVSYYILIFFLVIFSKLRLRTGD